MPNVPVSMEPTVS